MKSFTRWFSGSSLVPSRPFSLLVRGFLVTATAGITIQAHAGTGAHGGDLVADENNIWFLDDLTDDGDVLEYCIVRSNDFRFSEEITSWVVKKALEDWKVFFEKYGFDRKQFRLPFKDAHPRRLQMNFNYIDHCNDPEKQLAIYFGQTDHPLIERNRDLLRHSLGLAIPYEFDHETYQTGGVIWIAPWEYSLSKLREIVGHELGHVFGMPHNSVAIMNEYVAERIRRVEMGRFGTIESPTWKYKLLPGDVMDFTPKKRDSGCSAAYPMSNAQLPEQLRRIFDLQINGCHRIVMRHIGRVRIANAPRSRPAYQNRFRLEIGHVTPTGQTDVASLEGLFEYSPIKDLPNGLPSPSIFTSWGRPPHEGTTVTTWRLYLDEYYPTIPGRGHFAARNVIVNARSILSLKVFSPQELGAELINVRGPMVRVFFPGAATWWEISDPDYFPLHSDDNDPYQLFVPEQLDGDGDTVNNNN